MRREQVSLPARRGQNSGVAEFLGFSPIVVEIGSLFETTQYSVINAPRKITPLSILQLL
jgi:hypothetical protein